MKHTRIEEFLSLPSYYFPILSPSRKELAFFWDRTGRLELYTKTMPEGEAKQRSRGNVPRALWGSFIWGKDEKTIYFPRDEAGDEQHDIVALDLNTGETRDITRGKGQHQPVEISPGGSYLTMTSNAHDQKNLYLLHLENQEVTRLTHFSNPVHGGYWHPSGETIYFSANEDADLKNMDIYSISPQGGKPELLLSTQTGVTDHCHRVSPCGTYLSFNTFRDGYRCPGLLNLEKGTVHFLGGHGGDENVGSFSPSGAKLSTYLHKDAGIMMYEYDLATMEGYPLPLPGGVIASLDYLEENLLFFAHEDTSHRTAFYTFDLEKNTQNTIQKGEHGSFQDFQPGQYISYPSSDDLTIYGILYLPPGEGPHPAVVCVHGGPTGHDTLSFDTLSQFFLQKGFAVLQPNFRGSTGYGQDFMEMNIGDIGGGDGEDVACGAQYLQNLPCIDENRILCMGISYGGYMTYWQLVQKPELWAGGIAWVGITDWDKLYESSMEHFKFYLNYLFGQREENRDLFRERSPIQYVEQLKAPLQMIHGVNDPRVPIEQARIFRDALKKLGRVEGKDFQYHELGEEGHGSTDIQQKIRAFKLMESFLTPFQNEDSP